MTPSTVPPAYRLTYADWLALPDDGRLYEIVRGELFVNPTPSVRHQRVSGKLYRALARCLEHTELGEVFHAPIGVRLSDEDVPEPDLVVILTEHRDRIGEQVIEGAPDLVVEILSPGTAQRDVGLKRDLYERHGVPEYWIVDPVNERVEVLVNGSRGFERCGVYRRSDTLRSQLLPDFAVELEEVFPDS